MKVDEVVNLSEEFYKETKWKSDTVAEYHDESKRESGTVG